MLHRFRGSRSNLAIVAGLCLAVSGAVTAIAVSSPGRNSETQTPVVIELAALEAQAEASTEPELFMREAQIRPGDTVPALMAELGINDAALRTYLINDPDASRIVRRLRPGMIIESATDREGALSWLSLRSPGSELATRIQRGSDTDFALEDYTLDVQTTEQFAQGSIQSSLFAATDAQGLPDALALSMADIFASQIDFNTDLRRDDRFTVVYESMEFRGEQLKSGRIKAVEFVNAGKRYTAFWFDEGNGRGAYFDANGQSLRKGFLRSPLEFTRISSGFSNNRKHPLFKDIRAHRGTDFAAPTGTRVRASSDGRVEFVGSQRGYGNFIVLKHDGGYTTAYGHLNGFAKGLRKGQAVSQGDVIGFVGATGWATGPHLHYEFRKNNVHQDPMRVDLPGRPPLTGGRLQAFKAQNASLIARLENASVQVAQKD
ncbi:MAG: hypothetical protein BSR46_01445 [Candidatus Dactylopiibacterium carminicum]|nr:MAG: hypothetical protein BSR46_01445 [Candidatus Dactylopiibacterium carminicum]